MVLFMLTIKLNCLRVTTVQQTRQVYKKPVSLLTKRTWQNFVFAGGVSPTRFDNKPKHVRWAVEECYPDSRRRCDWWRALSVSLPYAATAPVGGASSARHHLVSVQNGSDALLVREAASFRKINRELVLESETLGNGLENFCLDSVLFWWVGRQKSIGSFFIALFLAATPVCALWEQA